MQRLMVIRPDYCDDFSCKGSSCHFTCCQGWKISITKEEERRICNSLNAEGKSYARADIFEKKILSAQHKTENCFLLREDGFCPLLMENGLCSLQFNFGEKILPDTCKKYPRVEYRYNNTVFRGLSPGCESVVEFLMKKQDGINVIGTEEFISRPLWGPTTPPQFLKNNSTVMAYYSEIYNLYLSLLQAREISLEHRLILIGIAIKNISKLNAEKKIKDIPYYLDRYLAKLETQEIKDSDFSDLREMPGAMLNNFFTLLNTGVSKYNTDFYFLSNKIQKRLSGHYKLKNDGDSMESIIGFSPEKFELCKHIRDKFLQGREYFWENFAIAHLFHSNAPFSKGMDVWTNYMYFVWLYSMMKFSLTALIDEEYSDNDLYHDISVLYRKWGHNKDFQKNAIDELEKNNCATLAHMVLILKSC